MLCSHKGWAGVFGRAGRRSTLYPQMPPPPSRLHVHRPVEDGGDEDRQHAQHELHLLHLAPRETCDPARRHARARRRVQPCKALDGVQRGGTGAAGGLPAANCASEQGVGRPVAEQRRGEVGAVLLAWGVEGF